MLDKITEIFCLVDDFCKEFEKAQYGHLLSRDTSLLGGIYNAALLNE